MHGMITYGLGPDIQIAGVGLACSGRREIQAYMLLNLNMSVAMNGLRTLIFLVGRV